MSTKLYPDWSDVRATWLMSLPRGRRLDALKHYISHTGPPVDHKAYKKAMRRQSWTEKKARQILKAPHTCAVCDSPASSLHMIVPICRSGIGAPYNSVLLCHEHKTELEALAKKVRKDAKRKPRKKESKTSWTAELAVITRASRKRSKDAAYDQMRQEIRGYAIQPPDAPYRPVFLGGIHSV